MINIVNNKCNEEGCLKHPSFNLPNEMGALFCKKHKKDNMINIINKKCQEENCLINPKFNFPDKKSGLYCSKHKKENMIDIVTKRCYQKGCFIRPSFNFPGETKKLYCFEHKKENMINVRDKTCQEKECLKCPTFNFPGETKKLYCVEHKKPKMINVTNNKCNYSNCKSLSIYGFKNKKPIYCSEHKQDNMVNLVLENKCSIKECQKEHDFEHDKIKYCLEHVPDKKYNIFLKRICKYCDIEEESDFICKECQKIKNKKEWSIVRYLRKEIDTKFDYDSSKMLQGCSLKRPDIFFELNKHCLIVEIDENQHKSYEDICECARINEIVNGIGGKSVIIIRYNPDTIKNKNKKIEYSNKFRLEVLVKAIKIILSKEYDKFKVEILQLFYNDNYDIYKPLKKEDITKIVCI
jgi:hypothetical protein